MVQSPVKNQRIEAVDALRGFAVMAILLVHNLEHFIFPVYLPYCSGSRSTSSQTTKDARARISDGVSFGE